MKILMQQVSAAGKHRRHKQNNNTLCIWGVQQHGPASNRGRKKAQTGKDPYSPKLSHFWVLADVSWCVHTGQSSTHWRYKLRCESSRNLCPSRQQQKVHNMAVIMLQNDLRPASAEAYLMIWTLVSIIRPVPPFFARYRKSGPLSVHFPSLPCCLSLLWLLSVFPFGAMLLTVPVTGRHLQPILAVQCCTVFY